jgi:hypothetical protein
MRGALDKAKRRRAISGVQISPSRPFISLCDSARICTPFSTADAEAPQPAPKRSAGAPVTPARGARQSEAASSNFGSSNLPVPTIKKQILRKYPTITILVTVGTLGGTSHQAESVSVRVKVYLPAVLAGVAGLLGSATFQLPPQPVSPAWTARKTANIERRRRAGMPNTGTSAKAAPPPPSRDRFCQNHVTQEVVKR